MTFFEPGVMVIVNATPDSFYGGSRLGVDGGRIREHIAEAATCGARYVDLGGYSSRPEADDISAEQEFDRLCVAMDVARGDEFRGSLSITVDTFRSSVVRALVERYGACFAVNDISAGELDDQMLTTVANLRLPYIAMHMRGTPATMSSLTDYDDVAEQVYCYLKSKVEQCRALGIDDLMLDPGFGFAKTVAQNFELMNALPRFADLGIPLLVGVSRKSMIYRSLNITPEDSLPGTTALNWQALTSGATIIRVHDGAPATQIFRLYQKYQQALDSSPVK